MICRNCMKAADAETINQVPMSEFLHAKCEYPDCYCQHRVGFGGR